MANDHGRVVDQVDVHIGTGYGRHDGIQVVLAASFERILAGNDCWITASSEHIELGKAVRRAGYDAVWQSGVGWHDREAQTVRLLSATV